MQDKAIKNFAIFIFHQHHHHQDLSDGSMTLDTGSKKSYVRGDVGDKCLSVSPDRDLLSYQQLSVYY